VVLSREAPLQGGYAVDLAGASGPAWAKAAAGSASLRFLDIARVATSISARIQRLEEGAEPAALGLGSDCTRLAAQDLPQDAAVRVVRFPTGTRLSAPHEALHPWS